jgi:hypothetical protein
MYRMLPPGELPSGTMANRRLMNVSCAMISLSLHSFNDAFNYSGYKPSNYRTECEKLILKNAERSGCDLI